jgi:hypothetical protein
MYVKGAENRPTRKASEKLRVANAERNMPSRSREKDFMRWYCWFVGAKERVSAVETRYGRTLLVMAKTVKTIGNI